jgi:peptidoglycan-associated lipoprotein
MRTPYALISLLLLAACGSDPARPPETPVATAEPAPLPPPAKVTEKPGDVPTKSDIVIDDAIKKACGITDAEAHFAYDSANIRAQDKAVLVKLATCFSTGPLKGREMRLVGHADPRGDEEYNMTLGGKRADNVKAAIAEAGMDGKKIATTSRGAMDATGTDEASWQKDRRVDVLLGN